MQLFFFYLILLFIALIRQIESYTLFICLVTELFSLFRLKVDIFNSNFIANLYYLKFSKTILADMKDVMSYSFAFSSYLYKCFGLSYFLILNVGSIQTLVDY